MKTLTNNRIVKNALAITALSLFCFIVIYLDSSFQSTKKLQIFLFGSACLTVLVSTIFFWRLFSKEKHKHEDIYRKKEQMFTTLLDNTSSVIFIKDLDGKYLYVNKECEKRFHILNDNVVGKTDFEIFSKEISEKYLESDKEVIESKTIIEREETSIHIDGIHTYINTKFPLFDADNNFYAICGIGTDITTRKKAEDEILHAKEEAERAREMEEHFLANASHEIRTPMNGIIGMTRQLIDTKLNKQQLDITNTVIDSANNLLTIINDLLDLSKIKAGKMELDEHDFRLSDILKKIEQTLHYSIMENHIKFHFHVDEGIPPALFGDSGKINQILMNLIGNSIKFTYEGEVMVEVKLKHQIKDQVQLEFNVRDSGIGIPKDKLDRIFESFTQVNQLGARKYGGTGLGLTIAKQLVEQQGGNILVNSKLGQGTVFTFTLLLKEGSIEHILFLEKSKNHNSQISTDFSHVTVLLVEDNKINQRVAVHELKKWKTNVEVANDADEAFKILNEKKIDVILMDLSMPGMDGYEATVYIRTRLLGPVKQVPIIAMTASALSDEKDKCFQIGMNDYISKPFEPFELHQKIAQFVPKSTGEITDEKHHQVTRSSKKMATLILLKEHASGDQDYMAEILTDCLHEFPVYMEELNKANEEANFEGVRYAAHKMKAPIALIGAEKIKFLLTTMESNVIKNQYLDSLPEHVKEVNKLMEKLYQELTSEIKKLNTHHHHN